MEKLVSVHVFEDIYVCVILLNYMYSLKYRYSISYPLVLKYLFKMIFTVSYVFFTTICVLLKMILYVFVPVIRASFHVSTKDCTTFVLFTVFFKHSYISTNFLSALVLLIVLLYFQSRLSGCW